MDVWLNKFQPYRNREWMRKAEKDLSHNNFHGVAARSCQYHIATDGVAVDSDAFYACLHAVGILHRDSVFATAETAGYGVFLSS